MNDQCSICHNESNELEIITLDTCNHRICEKCFVQLMDGGRSFCCPCDTQKSNNVIISNKSLAKQIAMSYCNFKSIVCDHCLDTFVGNKISDECLNVLIRMKSFKDYKAIKLDFQREIDNLFHYKFPVDNSLREIIREYEKKIFMKMEPTFHCDDDSKIIFNKVRKIIYNLRCECHFTQSPRLEQKLGMSTKLSEFFHNTELEYFFMQLNPFHLSRCYGYTRFYGQPFFKNYYERYERDIIQFQKIMHFSTALLLSQSLNNGDHYKQLYPFMFKSNGRKCLVCLKEILGTKFGVVESCSHKVCEDCVKQYLITKLKCPIDGLKFSKILMTETDVTSLTFLQNQPQIFDEVFIKLDEIIFNTVQHIHRIIPRSEKIWMNVSQLFEITDQIQKPRVLPNKNPILYGKKVQELLSIVEALCYSSINDESFFQSPTFYMYFCKFCQTNVDISVKNDGYLIDPSSYQRLDETIHLYIYLHHFAISIYNNFVSDIVATFQHFEKTDKILIDLKEHFNLDRPSHICLRQLRKDMPLLLSQHKYIDALKAIKHSLKKTKYLNHLCRSMMFY